MEQYWSEVPHPAEDLLQPHVYWEKVSCCFLSHLKLKIKNGGEKKATKQKPSA